MKKLIYASIAVLAVAGGLVFANRANRETTVAQATPKAAAAQMTRKEWEATPDGQKYLGWESSAQGMKVLAAAARIRKHTQDSSNMEAVVTSLSLPPGSRLGFGIMVGIDGEEYIMNFDPQHDSELNGLRTLKAGDKITIKGRAVSWAPKYTYPILAGNYVERDGKTLYKRIPRKGC